MEVHAVRAELGEAVHRLDRIERRADLVAERVPAGVADGPEPEGEVVLGAGLVRVVAHAPMLALAAAAVMARSPARSSSVVGQPKPSRKWRRSASNQWPAPT